MTHDSPIFSLSFSTKLKRTEKNHTSETKRNGCRKPFVSLFLPNQSIRPVLSQPMFDSDILCYPVNREKPYNEYRGQRHGDRHAPVRDGNTRINIEVRQPHVSAPISRTLARSVRFNQRFRYIGIFLNTAFVQRNEIDDARYHTTYDHGSHVCAVLSWPDGFCVCRHRTIFNIIEIN